MEKLISESTPHPFTQADLAPGAIVDSATIAINKYADWRDAHPDLIAEHIEDMSTTLNATAVQYGAVRRFGRLAMPPLGCHFNNQQEREFVQYFGLHNLGVELNDDSTAFLQGRLHDARGLRNIRRRDPLDTSFAVMKNLTPELDGLPETDWLENRVRYLRTILPEHVVHDGGLGKTLRIVMGVLTVAAYDVAAEPLAVRQEHLQRVIPAAYTWGSTYAMVDDTLQSRASKTITDGDKEHYDEAILESLKTGEPLELAKLLPNHPISAELDLVYGKLLDNYPFHEYRHLYQAIEAIYGAQQREMQLTPESVVAAGGLRSMYPNMLIKAGMTRVVANILGRREVTNDSYTKFLHFVFGTQFKDDFEDHEPDALGGDHTIYTLPYDSTTDAPGPLIDLFAYDAYIRKVVWAGHSDTVQRLLLRYTPSEFAPYLANHKNHGPRILETWPHTQEMARFIGNATGMRKKQAHGVMPFDMRLEERMRNILNDRDPNGVDARTFLADNLSYINALVETVIDSDNPLGEIANYALEAGGKRVRPGLTLMLATGLGVPREKIEPLLQAAEILHTSSLIFDDMPAQDGSSVRRGKPTAHVAFSEGHAQLAGIAMLSKAYALFASLKKDFPAERVTDVITYVDSSIGFDGLSLGQAMDLQQTNSEPVSLQEILETYRLKTSVALESSLVPLMILTGKSATEIQRIKDYARHAGIIFQIKDDLLDILGSKEEIGKDTQNDDGKANVARNFGINTAEKLITEHLAAGKATLERLTFDTRLLQSILHYFATRTK